MASNRTPNYLFISYSLFGSAEEEILDYWYKKHVSQVCKQLGFAMPMPIIIADTNWVRDEFCLLLNPGLGNLAFGKLIIPEVLVLRFRLGSNGWMDLRKNALGGFITILWSMLASFNRDTFISDVFSSF